MAVLSPEGYVKTFSLYFRAETQIKCLLTVICFIMHALCDGERAGLYLLLSKNRANFSSERKYTMRLSGVYIFWEYLVAFSSIVKISRSLLFHVRNIGKSVESHTQATRAAEKLLVRLGHRLLHDLPLVYSARKEQKCSWLRNIRNTATYLRYCALFCISCFCFKDFTKMTWSSVIFSFI